MPTPPIFPIFLPCSPVCTLSAKLLQSCPILCDPMDRSPQRSSVQGILQARVLRWVAVPSSRGSSNQGSNPHLLRLLHWQAGSLPLAPPGKPRPPYTSQQVKNGCLSAMKGNTIRIPAAFSPPTVRCLLCVLSLLENNNSCSPDTQWIRLRNFG